MPPDSETIAVIGAGRVGRELARRAAVAGYRVVLEDLIPTSLEFARREIRADVGRGRQLRCAGAGAPTRHSRASIAQPASKMLHAGLAL